MAGHSKWANIKHKKAAQDAKRGKIFTKLIREITVAAQQGGADEASNARLRDAVFKALKSNMKRDTIDNAIKRGAGGLDGAAMVPMRYEGYAPGGIAVLVDCLSDNKNRTVSDVRHAFTKHGGNLGTDGSVAYLFDNMGEIILAPNQSESVVMDIAIDAGALDVETDEDVMIVTTPVEQYHTIKQALMKANIDIEESALVMRPKVENAVDNAMCHTIIKLIDMLEDLDDVQTVYHNALFSEAFLDSLES